MVEKLDYRIYIPLNPKEASLLERALDDDNVETGSIYQTSLSIRPNEGEAVKEVFVVDPLNLKKNYDENLKGRNGPELSTHPLLRDIDEMKNVLLNLEDSNFLTLELEMDEEMKDWLSSIFPEWEKQQGEEQPPGTYVIKGSDHNEGEAGASNVRYTVELRLERVDLSAKRQDQLYRLVTGFKEQELSDDQFIMQHGSSWFTLYDFSRRAIAQD